MKNCSKMHHLENIACFQVSVLLPPRQARGSQLSLGISSDVEGRFPKRATQLQNRESDMLLLRSAVNSVREPQREHKPSKTAASLDPFGARSREDAQTLFSRLLPQLQLR